jgi:molybdenum cofactor synthesis domain-containing protein
MRVVPVYEAAGMVLCHDLTEIVPGKVKSRAFKKGHIVRREDIPKLLDIGKEHLYVWEINDNVVHENDAALRIAQAVGGPGICMDEASEGKVQLRADMTGLLKINTQALEEINEIEQVAVPTLHTNQRVVTGKVVAGCKIIPLVMDVLQVQKIEEICAAHFPLITVKAFRPLKVGVVTTGNEIYYGRITDQFGPVLERKFSELGSTIIRQIFVPDDAKLIAEAIHQLLREGAELIVTTGGMAVDPDDVTPQGIRESGGHIVSYGAPTLPGSMFMLAYLGKVPVLGLPGCVMFHKNTIFDLMVPRILAGEELTRRDIIRLAHGGLCTNCEECRYPDCAFGKGS